MTLARETWEGTLEQPLLVADQVGRHSCTWLTLTALNRPCLTASLLESI